ncbi:MAG: glycosyltransferase [bacterium]
MKTIILTVTNDLTYDRRMMRICEALATRYRVVLVGRRLPDSPSLDARAYEQVRLRCVFARGKIFYAEMNLRLFFYMLVHRFDLVCSIDLDTILAGFAASRLKGKPLVYDAHEIFTEIPELAHRPLVRKVWLAIERFVVPRVAHAYTVNASLAEIFRERYGARFEIIRNVPPRPPATAAGPRGRTILYQGVLNVGRGLEALVDALPSLDAELVLIGEGDISDALRAQVQRLGLEQRVRFDGYVRPSEMPDRIRSAAVALNLRERLGLNDYFSLGNKFFDYIHAGVPQITMNFPEYARINAEHEIAVLIDDLSSATIRGAIERLLGDTAFYERLRANCRAASAVYNWEHESARLLAFYDGILGPVRER